MVVATQNPADHHGTYPLPESQLDRFLMRLRIGYPDRAAEREIVRQKAVADEPARERTITSSELMALQDLAATVRVDESLVDYMLAIVERTRSHESLVLGVSPRGAQALYRAAQAMAAVDGRDYVMPDDVKRMVAPVCAHRVLVNSRAAFLGAPASASAEAVLGEILASVEVPL
jgi:MoxR-like ATPase